MSKIEEALAALEADTLVPFTGIPVADVLTDYDRRWIIISDGRWLVGSRKAVQAEFIRQKIMGCMPTFYVWRRYHTPLAGGITTLGKGCWATGELYGEDEK
jgi:hypothetical protein